MKGITVWTTLAVAMAAGCSSAPPAPEPSARTTSAIQGGTDDTTHQFVVAVYVDQGNGNGALCSGSLLAPNLVATARHCVANLASPTIDCATSNFGSVYAASQFVVSNSAVLDQNATTFGVSKVLVPSGPGQTGVCGNDIALIILSQNVQLPQYVTPAVSPPITDHQTWATSVTAIGYGIDSPSDTNSAGVRRIKQDIALTCIPGDTTIPDCMADPAAAQLMTAAEFQSGDGTCEGDSGSGAFDQNLFDAGTWTSFGVLSRGNDVPGATTCTGAIYTRFDAWASLLVEAANEASAAGGYPLPVWVSDAVAASSGGASSGGGSAGGTTSATSSTGLADGASCVNDGDCSSQNCVSENGGGSYVCAPKCTTTHDCPGGSSCNQGFCFADAPTSGPASAGCSAGETGDPTHPVPWRSAAAIALAGLAAALLRRRTQALRA